MTGARAGGWRRAAATAVAWILRLLASTWRVRFEGPDPLAEGPDVPRVAAVWHRNILLGAAVYRDRGFVVPISRSRDGDWVSHLVEALGWAVPPRGSSSRGGTAVLRTLVRRVRAGATIAVPCDGPRGPARRSKPGVLALARLAARPVIPVALGARPAHRFRSWDGTLLPAPFARVVCRYGTPPEIPPEASDEDLASLAEELDRRLNALTDAVDGELWA